MGTLLNIQEHFINFFSKQRSQEELFKMTSDFDFHLQKMIFDKEDNKIDNAIKYYQGQMDEFIKEIDNEENIKDRNYYYDLLLKAKSEFEGLNPNEILTFSYSNFEDDFNKLKPFLDEINIQLIKKHYINESVRDWFAEYLLNTTTSEIKEYNDKLGFEIDLINIEGGFSFKIKEDLTRESPDLTKSAIEKWLFVFKEQNILTESAYNTLESALIEFFEKGSFPNLPVPINVGRVNKKLLGWNLNRIFHSMGKGIELDLLRFAQTHISTFRYDSFDEGNYRDSNLYKYFTTKTE